MPDFSIQEFLQKRSARTLSGEELEIFGKHAAQRYAAGEGTLSEAVIEEVKQAGLSPEQVRRVVEFANTSAFLQEFNKEGTEHRVVEFRGGPADPSIILQGLNGGGEKVAFDHGSLDYQSPPSRAKTSAANEMSLRDLFSQEAPPNTIPEENPYGDVVDFRDKVAGLCDHLTSELSGLETIYEDLCDELYGQVKQAALEGISLGDVVVAWSEVTDEPIFVKAAFEVISPRLEKTGVFKNALEICESLEKTAGQKLVNVSHPLVTGFSEYCDALAKLAGLREERDEALHFLKLSTAFLTNPNRGEQADFIASLVKEAVGGLVGKAFEGADALSGPAASAAHGVGKVLFGEGHGAKTLGKAVGGAVKYAPHAAGAAVGVRALQNVNASGVGQALQSFVPGTQAYQQKQFELQQRYGNMPGYGY